MEATHLHAQPTVTADVSSIQAHLRAAELVRVELAKRFGAALATQLVDRALGHESVRGSRTPLMELRAVVAGELLGRIGDLLVATGAASFAERDEHEARLTAPETPQAIDRSEVRRALA
jgi:hypothetical protein